MQHRGYVDDVHLGLHGIQLVVCSAGGEQVAGEHVCVQAPPVLEELVPELRECGLEVETVELGAGHALLVHQEAQLLPETTPSVEEGGAEAQARQSRRVVGMVWDGVVEEADLADAGVGPDGKSFVADGEDVGYYFFGWDMAVVLEQAVAGRSYRGDILCVPRDLFGGIDLGVAFEGRGAMVAFSFHGHTGTSRT